ncbi:ammonium transporter [Novispirillum itersonii]|uniref:Amt family ammonium transporter n=1 Tax=Novispirillum itersonii TaxID=189 RepID=A0A7W9ZEG0_NOVIT|nr:ammonium transporter [Novispirillum itersonii]MBB6209112.1 Amt family ammonium transporter [Novispirillum itersonii]
MHAGLDVFFLLIGAAMVLAMHAGFAFLEAGTVRRKNQVNALVKIITDLGVSTVVYFAVGYTIAYGTTFFVSATELTGGAGGAFKAQGVDLVKFFFLLMFAAAIPAIISGGIAERAKFWPQLMATAIIVGLIYPLMEGMVWGGRFGLQDGIEALTGAKFHDFAGSVVVHAFGGWLALGAVILLGARRGRYTKAGQLIAIPPSNIPFLALGSWILCVGWFGFNVMSSQSVETASGLVAMNSLLAMVGGLLAAVVAGRNDPGFIHNGALAGLVAVCAGSDVMHPLGALVTGGLAGGLFVWGFNRCQIRWKIDDVLGVWPLHGLCGTLGGLAAGVFGQQALGGIGGVSLTAQILGTAGGVAFAAVSGFVVYGLLKRTVGIRLDAEDEHRGADLSIHQVPAYPEEELIR